MTIAWSGCWEERPGRIICRWMLAWGGVEDSLAGCIAGFSGGGAFQCEKFLGEPGRLVLDCDDDLTSTGSEELVDLSEDCLDLILQMHDDDLWVNADNLVLCDITVLPKSRSDKDLIYAGEDDVPQWAEPLFERTGLISRPHSFV
jgi:hypothetical protein